MDFPQFISFTITNACNLRCKMCGQWSEEGYIKNKAIPSSPQMELDDWKRLIDEAAQYKIRFILIRGGEPFLYPGIIELVEYIHSKGIFVSIDTNGTVMSKFVADLIRIGNMHITFSIDGTEEIHDDVRGVKGSFNKTKENIALLNRIEEETNKHISKSVCFTISKDSYKSLGEIPDVMRDLGIKSLNIVPYYFVSEEVGEKYADELEQNFNCKAFSWKGFHHDNSGINFDIFLEEHKKYLDDLNGIVDFPYMPLTDEEYKTWFSDSITPVGSLKCENVENLIDIQPNGDTNFCVDFPDYSFGNVKHSSIKELWDSPEAAKFRNYRREKPLAVCYRCGGKYISEIKE